MFGLQETNSPRICRLMAIFMIGLPLGGCYTVGARYPYGYNPYVYTYRAPVSYSPQTNYEYDGNLVSSIKIELNRIGYLSSSPNPLFDARTRGAIRRAQVALGLPVDGIPREELLRALRSADGSRDRRVIPSNAPSQPQQQETPRNPPAISTPAIDNRAPSEPGQVQRNRDLLKQMDNLE